MAKHNIRYLGMGRGYGPDGKPNNGEAA